MGTHPLTDDPKQWTAAGILALSLMGIQSLLLVVYSHTPPGIAIADGVLTIGLLAVVTYWAWYANGFMPLRLSRIVFGIMAMIIWLTGCFAIQSLIEWTWQEPYISYHDTFLFRLLFGGLLWIGIMLWYRIQILSSELRFKEEEATTPTGDEQGQKVEIIDRITVKDGSRIHLIEVEKLLYIEACGDYVTLVTAEGQHVKEQTMKYFETHLSSGLFVRIHRSYIVNVSQISRVELFGKENYQMLLKNGTKLKMSSSGYKLLKDKLNL